MCDNLKVTKKQGFTVALVETFMKKTIRNVKITPSFNRPLPQAILGLREKFECKRKEWRTKECKSKTLNAKSILNFNFLITVKSRKVPGPTLTIF